MHRRGAPFSVGIVGTHENMPHIERVRKRLDKSVYLWVNAYQREPNYYSAEQLAAIRAVDPYFDLNNQSFPSLGRPCSAGQRALYLDDEGDLRRAIRVAESADQMADGCGLLCYQPVGDRYVVLEVPSRLGLDVMMTRICEQLRSLQ